MFPVLNFLNGGKYDLDSNLDLYTLYKAIRKLA